MGEERTLGSQGPRLPRAAVGGGEGAVGELHTETAEQARAHEDLQVLAPAAVVAFREHVCQVVAGEEVVRVRMSRLLVEALFGQDVGFEERVQPEIQPLHRERREAFAQPEPFSREPDGGPVRRGPPGERGLDIHTGDPGRQAIRALHPEVPEYEERLQDRGPEEVPVVGSVHRSCRAVESGSGRRESRVEDVFEGGLQTPDGTMSVRRSPLATVFPG